MSPRIIGNESSLEKKLPQGRVVTVCSPALVRSAATSPFDGKGPKPRIPVHVKMSGYMGRCSRSEEGFLCPRGHPRHPQIQELPFEDPRPCHLQARLVHLPPSGLLTAQFISRTFPLYHAIHINCRNMNVFWGKRPHSHNFFTLHRGGLGSFAHGHVEAPGAAPEHGDPAGGLHPSTKANSPEGSSKGRAAGSSLGSLGSLMMATRPRGRP